MTNFEWLKQQIANADKDELREIISRQMPWCAATPTDECNNDCEECANKWLEETHNEPMPELKVGMLVRVIDSYGAPCFGIIREYKGKNIVSYTDLDGGYDWIDDEDIIIDTVYDSPSVLHARNYDKSIIWRR